MGQKQWWTVNRTLGQKSGGECGRSILRTNLEIEKKRDKFRQKKKRKRYGQSDEKIDKDSLDSWWVPWFVRWRRCRTWAWLASRWCWFRDTSVAISRRGLSPWNPCRRSGTRSDRGRIRPHSASSPFFPASFSSCCCCCWRCYSA